MIDAIEGFYIALIVDGLHRSGVLRNLSTGDNVASIAGRLGIDTRMLSRLLKFVALRSSVVRATARGGRGDATRYRLSPSFQLSRETHLLDQYLGAYGPCLLALPQILRSPHRGERYVDRVRHSHAFVSGQPPIELISMIEAFDISRLLDLGCGGGQLLGALARRRKDFKGIGIDASLEMVRHARRSLATGRLARRVTIRHSDVRHLARVVPRGERLSIDAVCAASVANGFFGSDTFGIDRFLRGLRRLFPRRLLFLCDYYSCLDLPRAEAHGFRRTLVHDVAQVISGQGTPPGGLSEWQKIYRRNGVTLLQSCTRTDDGVAWFIHLVRL